MPRQSFRYPYLQSHLRRPLPDRQSDFFVGEAPPSGCLLGGGANVACWDENMEDPGAGDRGNEVANPLAVFGVCGK